MQNDVAEFTSPEVSGVLRYYDIGTPRQIRSLSAGNRASPKLLVTTDRGVFVLKRRPKGKDDAQNVDFTHAVQDHLEAKGYPVAGLVTTRDQASALYLTRHTYELFHFAYHVDPQSWLGRLPLIYRLRRNHVLHHDKALMTRYNFNITYPICDRLFGTLYSEIKRGPGPGEGP